MAAGLSGRACVVLAFGAPRLTSARSLLHRSLIPSRDHVNVNVNKIGLFQDCDGYSVPTDVRYTCESQSSHRRALAALSSNIPSALVPQKPEVVIKFVCACAARLKCTGTLCWSTY